jgi:glutamine synthetase
MTEGVRPNDPIEGTAYDMPFSLHRHLYSAIDAMEKSEAMRKTLGDEFVTLYCALKNAEYREFQEIVTPWEREILMFNV